MKVFMVVILIQCSAMALIKKETCQEQQHLKQTEMQILKDKMNNDPHADVDAIVMRMYVLSDERNAIIEKCKR